MVATELVGLRGDVVWSVLELKDMYADLALAIEEFYAHVRFHVGHTQEFHNVRILP